MSLDPTVLRSQRRRGVALVFALLFLLVAPSAFALGGPAEGFDFLGLSSLWQRAVAAWGASVDGAVADRETSSVDAAAGPGFEKIGSITDPYGNPGASSPPATSTTSSAAGPTAGPVATATDG